MSMNGEYLRLHPDELAHALVEPEWLEEHVGSVLESEDDPRRLETHKAWDAIRFLLDRRGFPVDIVHGETDLGTEDWGYGPPRYVRPDRVSLAAGTLASLTFDDLTRDITPADLREAGLYPVEIWRDADALEFVRRWFEPLRPFFQQAAAAGDAVLVWLD